MTDKPDANSSTQTCWFCETYPPDESLSVTVRLVMAGQEDKNVPVPRCAVCASTHARWLGLVLGILAGILLDLLLWNASWLVGLLAFCACAAVGAFLGRYLNSRKYREDKARITTKPESSAADCPIVQQLISEGWLLPADAERDQKELLEAIDRHDVDGLREILDKKPKAVNGILTGDETPIQRSLGFKAVPRAVESEGDPLAIVKLLVERGGDLSVRGVLGRMLLHMACVIGFREAAEYLVKERGFSPNTRDERGETPLHCAADPSNLPFYGDRGRLAEFLISAGADVNALNIHNETPLIVAIPHGSVTWCECGVPETVRVLLAFGADASVKRQPDGKTAYQLLLECEKDTEGDRKEYSRLLALFEGGKRVGICESCGELIFANEPFYERREAGSESIPEGVLHYDVGRGLYHKRCAERAGLV